MVAKERELWASQQPSQVPSEELAATPVDTNAPPAESPVEKQKPLRSATFKEKVKDFAGLMGCATIVAALILPVLFWFSTPGRYEADVSKQYEIQSTYPNVRSDMERYLSNLPNASESELRATEQLFEADEVRIRLEKMPGRH